MVIAMKKIAVCTLLLLTCVFGACKSSDPATSGTKETTPETKPVATQTTAPQTTRSETSAATTKQTAAVETQIPETSGVTQNVQKRLDIDISSFVPTKIETYDTLTVLSNDTKSYICTPYGDVIYSSENYITGCGYCHTFFDGNDKAIGIILDKESIYTINEVNGHGHGGGSGKTVYDINSGKTYIFSASEGWFSMMTIQDAHSLYTSGITLYPAVSYALPAGTYESAVEKEKAGQLPYYNFTTITGPYGIVDINNNIVVPFEYQDISRYIVSGTKAYALAKKDGKCFFIDQDGALYKDSFAVAGLPVVPQFLKELKSWVYDGTRTYLLNLAS